jgi:hypothetical protein
MLMELEQQCHLSCQLQAEAYSVQQESLLPFNECIARYSDMNRFSLHSMQHPLLGWVWFGFAVCIAGIAMMKTCIGMGVHLS